MSFFVTQKPCAERVNIARETCGSNVHAHGTTWPIHSCHSLFPQLRRKIHATLEQVYSSRAIAREHFHQSTALITTTSFMSLIFFDSFCESPMSVKIHISHARSRTRGKSSDRRISTISG